MSKRNSRGFTAAIFSMALIVFLGLVGCSEVPTSVEQQDSATLLTRNVSAQKVLGDADYTEAIISAAEGGTLSLYDVSLYFPPGALSNDTLISIDIPDLSVFANDFGTSGLQFNVPVRVTMSYRDADLSGIDETNIKMAWFNERTGLWDIIGCELDVASKMVTADVYHFSAYGLVSD